MADKPPQNGPAGGDEYPPIVSKKGARVAVYLIALALEMRAKQRLYLRSRKYRDLIKAKAAEEAFDKAALEATK